MRVLIAIPDPLHSLLKNEAWEIRMSLTAYINKILVSRAEVKISDKGYKDLTFRGIPVLIDKKIPNGIVEFHSPLTLKTPITQPPMRCQVPGGICRGYGSKYAIAYFDQEGLVKKEVYLCLPHAAKLKETAESVVSI